MSHYVLHTHEGVIRQVLMLSQDAPAPSVEGLVTLAVSEHVDGTRSHVANGAIVAGLLDLRTPEQRETAAWSAARTTRNNLLASSDWVTLRQFELGGTLPQAWAEYRQALRDITLQVDPINLVWPTSP